MDRPWETEPNELKWNDKATGLLCWIVCVRPEFGLLSVEHPWGFTGFTVLMAPESLERVLS